MADVNANVNSHNGIAQVPTRPKISAAGRKSADIKLVAHKGHSEVFGKLAHSNIKTKALGLKRGKATGKGVSKSVGKGGSSVRVSRRRTYAIGSTSAGIKSIPTSKVSQAALIRAAVEREKEEEAADGSKEAVEEISEESRKDEEVIKQDLSRIGQWSDELSICIEAKHKPNKMEKKSAHAKKAWKSSRGKGRHIAPQSGRKLSSPGNHIKGKPIGKRK